MKNLHTKFQNDICSSNGDIIVQKNNMKNQNFAFFMPYLSEEKLNFHENVFNECKYTYHLKTGSIGIPLQPPVSVLKRYRGSTHRLFWKRL